ARGVALPIAGGRPGGGAQRPAGNPPVASQARAPSGTARRTGSRELPNLLPLGGRYSRQGCALTQRTAARTAAGANHLRPSAHALSRSAAHHSAHRSRRSAEGRVDPGGAGGGGG